MSLMGLDPGVAHRKCLASTFNKQEEPDLELRGLHVCERAGTLRDNRWVRRLLAIVLTPRRRRTGCGRAGRQTAGFKRAVKISHTLLFYLKAFYDFRWMEDSGGMNDAERCRGGERGRKRES
ncbi:hypothetical protein D3C78_1446820 [compost metagenome]